jgi:hypothetical protein
VGIAEDRRKRAAAAAKTADAPPARGQESLNRYMGEDKYLIRPPKRKREEQRSGAYDDDPDNPGEIIINWDYDDGGGETLRQFHANSLARMTERNGGEWMEENRSRLDNEFKSMLVRGLLT